MAFLLSCWILAIFVTVISVAQPEEVQVVVNTTADSDILSILDDMEVLEEPMLDNAIASKRRIEDNIETLLKQGFEKARAIVRSRHMDAQMRMNSLPERSMATVFHGRVAEPETKLLSECKALGLLESSKLVVEKYNISHSNVEELLRSIEIPPGLCKEIEDMCSKLMSSRMGSGFAVNCNHRRYDKYRTINGECNNRLHQNFGKSGIPFRRILSADYDDGVSSPRGGNKMPNPRRISVALSAIPKQKNPKSLTQMFKAWGQFLDHDIVMTPEVEVRGCCDDGKYPFSPKEDCMPINVTTDGLYSTFNIKCLRFRRSLPFCEHCVFGKREQLNQVTAYLDGSNVYGSSNNKAMRLRTKKGGKLKVNKKGEKGTCSESCPYAFLPPSSALGEQQNHDAPFTAGDVRVNEQPGLTSMHTMFVRYHNKLAEKIAQHRPDLNDEILYQESRKLVVAMMQHITYTEFLPILLGRSFYIKSGLLTPPFYHHYTNYNSKSDPAVSNVFGMAYRFGHSLIKDDMGGKEPFGLAGKFFKSEILTHENMYPSNVLESECKLESEQVDVFLVNTITDKLFTFGNDTDHGTDLMALNIMRGRDHGLPGYNEWRKFSTGKKFKNFKDLRKSNVMLPKVVDVLQELYGNVDNIDLFPGGLAERRMKGAFIGRTFYWLLRDQFLRLKHADRFWYENKDAGFSPNVMALLKKATLSSVMCEATEIKHLQKYVMLTGDHPSNLRKPCRSIIQDYSLIDDKEIQTIAYNI